MKTIQILGSGCAKCQSTAKLVEEVAKAKGAEIRIEGGRHAKDVGYGVMSTPGVVIDG